MVGDDNIRPVQQEHASKTQIHTVAEVKPTECASKCVKEKIEIKDLLTGSTEEKVAVEDIPVVSPIMTLRQPVIASERELEAKFVRDTISDGTTFEPEKPFVQVWTLTNPGPVVWPAGCSVRYVGGDNMLNVDENRPSSESDISKATESNIIRRDVQVGEEISFRVLMKAPKREGVAISYWRLKTADGIPFGHRLWCHINVSSKSAVPEKQETRDIGRAGVHDAFLRYNMTEQLKQESRADEQIKEKLVTLREALREHRAQNGLSLRDINTAKYVDAAGPCAPAHIEKRKIEVVEATEKPVEKADKEKATQLLSFPTLDMQSSASSAGKEPVPTNAADAESVPAVAPAPAQVEPEIFDDAESINLLDDSSSDDGFLTEDEYDILDASDEEIV